jgi:hypothetical protein
MSITPIRFVSKNWSHGYEFAVTRQGKTKVFTFLASEWGDSLDRAGCAARCQRSHMQDLAEASK